MPSVTRKSQSNRAQRREEIRERLLEAVERALASGDSYTELSVERLANEAKLSRSTFYVYFEDKGDLLRVLVADVIGRLIEATRVWWDLPRGFTRDDVHDAMTLLIDTYRPHNRLLGAVADTASYDAGVREAFMEMMDLSVKGVEDHIIRGQREGFVRPEIDPHPVASWLTWMTERGLYELVPGADDAVLARLADAQATIIWNTLYVSPNGR
jgi:TetR/AcrR family transcriptional regulator, ethionamide resistance regulator